MNEKEVKDYIGESNWGKFIRWTHGHTCGLDDKGNTDYYRYDVEAFKRTLEGKPDRKIHRDGTKPTN